MFSVLRHGAEAVPQGNPGCWILSERGRSWGMFSPGLGCGRLAPSDMRKSLSVIRVLVVELPADSDNTIPRQMRRSDEERVLQCVRQPGFVLVAGPSTFDHQAVVGRVGAERHDDVGCMLGSESLA